MRRSFLIDFRSSASVKVDFLEAQKQDICRAKERIFKIVFDYHLHPRPIREGVKRRLFAPHNSAYAFFF